MTKPRLSSACVDQLVAAYFDAYGSGLARPTGIVDAEVTAGWSDVEGWDGELDFKRDPCGRRWLLDSDEPRNAVDVTDIPLAWESDRYFVAQWVDDDEGWSIAVATSAREALVETCSAMDGHAERDVEPLGLYELGQITACMDCGNAVSSADATAYVCEECEAAVICFSCFTKYEGCKACESPGAPYRVQLCEVVPVKLSSLVDLDDDGDGEPRCAWEVLESAAFNAGGATEYYPTNELTPAQETELDQLLALQPAEARAAALDDFAAKVWSFGWWNVLRIDGARREVEITLSADTDTWDAALPEWAK